nr:RNA polymerase sigma factor [Subtercola boreus]
MDVSDRELLAGSVAGDRGSLAAILARHARPVTRYAWALVGSAADAEEVVQDTFLTCWRKAETIDLVDDSLLPWLLATCRYLSMNLNRSRYRHSTEELPDDLLVTDHDGAARERLRWVREEIAQLTPLDRRVTELCLLEGRSYAEAAEELGLSVGAVRQRVSRSRGRLRKAVTDNEE